MLHTLHSDDFSSPKHHRGTYAAAYPQQQHHHHHHTRAALLHRHPLVRVLLLAALLAAATAASLHLLQQQRSVASSSSSSSVRHALIIDSGSSGTRIYAYTWAPATPSANGHADRQRNTGGPAEAAAAAAPWPVVRSIPPEAAAHLVPQHAERGMYSRVETRPGLDAAAAAANATGGGGGVAGALEPLLAWARAVVPPQQHAATPLFLLATGGLRRLAPGQQAALLQDVRRVLARSGFWFEPGMARVISGDQEGAYGWLALNYQQGRLRVPSASPAAAAAATQSLGALDLGGASLQVTFQVREEQQPASAFNITLAGHTFQLHLHSFKGFGLNDVFDRAVTALLRQQQGQAHTAAAAAGPATAASNTTSSNTTSSSSIDDSLAASLTTAAGGGSSSRSGGLTVEAAVQQHDLAVARAAGVVAEAAAAAAHEGGTTAAGSSDGLHAGPVPVPSFEQLAEQQAADLAAAAAAGVQPDDTHHSHPSTSSSSSHDEPAPALSGLRSSSDSASATSRGGVGHAAGAPLPLQLDGGAASIQGRRNRPRQLLAAARRRAPTAAPRWLRRRQDLMRQLQALVGDPAEEPSPAAAQGDPHQASIRLRQLLEDHFAGGVRGSGTSEDTGAALSGPARPRTTDSSSSSGLPVIVRHPCLHAGFEGRYSRLVSDGVVPQPAEVLLRGAPDWDACLRLVDTLLNASTPCSVSTHRPACVLGTPQPALTGTFMALAGYHVVAKFLNVTSPAIASSSSPRSSLAPLLDASRALCARSWPDVRAALGSHINVERYCLWGPYAVQLLLDARGLGLAEHQVQIAADGGLGWPLGAVLVEAGGLPGFDGRGGARARPDAQGSSSSSGLRAGRGSLRGTGSLQLGAPPVQLQQDAVAQQTRQQQHKQRRRRHAWRHPRDVRAHGTSRSKGALHLSGWLLAALAAWIALQRASRWWPWWGGGATAARAGGVLHALPAALSAGHLPSFTGGGGPKRLSPARASFKSLQH